MKQTFTVFALSFLSLTTMELAAQADSLVLSPVADNTIYSENNNSNSTGTQLFAGATNEGNFRRALIRFSFSAIPANATITSVELQVTPNKGGTGAVSVHKLTQAWGEGNSQGTGNQGQGASSGTGDATWNFSNFSTTNWANAGGDYHSEASAATTLSNNQITSWIGEDLLADVQEWVTDPNQNFGWILIGNENTSNSAMRFNSREGSNPPQLIVRFETTTPTRILAEQDLTITLAPNPAFDNLQMNWTLQERPDALMMDVRTIHGKLIRQQALAAENQGQLTVFVGDLNPGTYILTLRTEVGIRSLRFVKH